ncbi:hypothetical protein Pan216_15940 [Planctomycetes bacterium Pan216]|uniref:Uncharacterized protein n=1 Tax=Kolteria novifilia TaxID=2527975 RepID=A0A518B194_9BACT|nr:hypothetical protein Pan216_15940 [Planctomycetes bacterium Pan216]
MSDEKQWAILNRAFIRLFRSFAYYMTESGPVFDIGEEPLKDLVDRQVADANEFGEFLFRQHGAVQTGSYPLDFGNFNFINTSRLVADWIDYQLLLVDGLQQDRNEIADPEGPGVALLDAIILRARDTLATLRRIESELVPA